MPSSCVSGYVERLTGVLCVLALLPHEQPIADTAAGEGSGKSDDSSDNEDEG